MARPRKQGLTYFPHDVDAVNDEKIEALRSLHGNDGYAFYFILLERIYRTQTGEIDISNQIKKAAIINKIGIDADKFQKILNDAFELELFDKGHYEETGSLTSQGVRKRLGEVEKLREKWRKKKDVFSGENHVGNDLENEQKTAESKGKESKVNINNNNINNTSVNETDSVPYQEIIDLFNSICVSLPKLRSIEGNRQKTVRALWKKNNSLDYYRELFERVEKSDFLTGRSGNWNNCGFDWIVKPSNLQKIIEGNYDNKNNAPAATPVQQGRGYKPFEVDEGYREYLKAVENQ